MTLAQRGAELVLERVDVTLGGRRILADIDLRVGAGEFVTVIGRSGSGKSTLLRALAGLEQPSRGRLQVGARPIVVFQEPRLLPWRSVLQNVCLGVDPPDPVAATAVLEQVGLRDRVSDYPSALSGGERQRVALARALIHRPQLMLLDEPFRALDALTRISAQRLVEQLWSDGGFTALLVTHDVEEAVLLGDRVLVIEDGRIRDEFAVDLPRPRARKSPEVAALAARLLEAIFGDHEPARAMPPNAAPRHPT
jgi:sulfonate transport system ATP-binding protein